ncbi:MULTISPECIES: hypothetical protein [unclassified Chelatococcus]|uniref:hypothetical protein n=1 Tax=unclassified Chelatococcus TaxID=2638111 RepID=UPI000474E6E6|nr:MULTISPECIES: hypothetical protein [unclassified Chelatococcus]
MQVVENSVVPPLSVVTAFSQPPRQPVSLEQLHVGATEEADVDGVAVELRRALASAPEVDDDRL